VDEGARWSGRLLRSCVLPRGGGLSSIGGGPLTACASTLGRPTARTGRASLLRPRSRSGEGRRGGWGGRLRRRLDRGGWSRRLRRRLGWAGRLGPRRRSRRRRGGRVARRSDGLPHDGWGRGRLRRADHGGRGRLRRDDRGRRGRVRSDLRGAGRGIGGLLRGRDGGRPKDESPHGNGCRDASHRPSHPAEWSLRLQGCHPPRSADHTELRP
jgi:hypothetical protein